MSDKDDETILGLQRRIQSLEHDLGACRISNKMYNERICRLDSYQKQLKAGTIQFDVDVLHHLIITYKYRGYSFISE